MTCHELRLHFEDPMRMDADFLCEAEHLAHCTECARFVEGRRQLGDGLRLVRESAPQPSPALETAVLANYRRRATADVPLMRPGTQRLTAVRWIAAAAAVLALAAAILFRPTQRLATSGLRIESAPPPMAQANTAKKNANGVAYTNRRFSAKRRERSARQRLQATVATTKTPDFEDFRSLMYCDALSCGGTMQLIRVELPFSGAAFEPAAAPTGGVIYADVLVGSDGIARGIRVVQ